MAEATANWSVGQEERFLLTARVANIVPVSEGLTHTEKCLMSDGRITHAAHIQTIDVYLPEFRGKDGSYEKNFRDSWKYNVAAYRLAKLIHLTNMIPVSVERNVIGKPGSLDWWIDNVLMDEKARRDRHIDPPDLVYWQRAMDTMHVFDQLIYNVDRNQENLLITKDWKVWLIDHTRAFRLNTNLRDPRVLTRCDADLLHAIKKLRKKDVERECMPYLTQPEIDALMVRRDLIVQLFTSKTPPAPEGRASSFRR